VVLGNKGAGRHVCVSIGALRWLNADGSPPTQKAL
jgi:hypothetical protein